MRDFTRAKKNIMRPPHRPKHSDKSHIIFAFQGGAAHVGFALGVTEAILQDADVIVSSITGTSAGAQHGAFVAEGLAKGGPEFAVERAKDFWGYCAAYQKIAAPEIQLLEACAHIPGVDRLQSALSGIYSHAQAVSDISLANFADITTYGRNLADTWLPRNYIGDWHRAAWDSFERVCQRRQPLFPVSPLYGLHAFMESHGKELDIKTLQATPPGFAIINATAVPENVDPWTLNPAVSARVFTGERLSLPVIVASGAIDRIMPREHIANRRGVVEAMCDGGYSGNPHLDLAIEKGMKDNAALVVVRARKQGYAETADSAGAKGYDSTRFNSMTDKGLEDVRQKYPGLKICVIQPETIETRTIAGLSPEYQFGTEATERRRLAGYRAASAAIAQRSDIFPARPLNSFIDYDSGIPFAPSISTQATAHAQP